MTMAKNTIKILGEVGKRTDFRGKPCGWSVPLEITFPDGRTTKYNYGARTRKELLASMENGSMQRWIDCAQLDTPGMISFVLSLY
jgi:hypothetical protein